MLQRYGENIHLGAEVLGVVPTNTILTSSTTPPFLLEQNFQFLLNPSR